MKNPFRNPALITIAALSLAFLLGGCSRGQEISGEIFIVTKARDNVKLGLVGVHVLSDKQLKTVAAKVLSAEREDEMQRAKKAPQLEADKAALGRFERELDALDALVPFGLNVPEIANLKRASKERLYSLPNSLPNARAALPLADRLFSSLPPPVVKSDANGQFSIRSKTTVWLLARAERKVGSEDESYLWAVSAGVQPAKVLLSEGVQPAKVLLSNDDLMEEGPSLRAFLGRAAGVSATPLPIPPVAANPEITGWIATSMVKAKEAVQIAKAQAEAKAVAEAKAAAEAKTVAKAEAAAEAKALAEKRLEWTGAAMRRAGFEEAIITRTLTQGGTVVAWGYNGNGLWNVPTDLNGVVAIAAGWRHTVALKNDGTVVAWGKNDDGQTNVPTDLNGVVAIAAGTWHTIALKKDGAVVAWGKNGERQTTVPRGLNGVVAIAGGFQHTVALKNDGTVVAWGSNKDILGINAGQTTVPTGLNGVVAIAAGRYHTVALRLE